MNDCDINISLFLHQFKEWKIIRRHQGTCFLFLSCHRLGRWTELWKMLSNLFHSLWIGSHRLRKETFFSIMFIKFKLVTIHAITFTSSSKFNRAFVSCWVYVRVVWQFESFPINFNRKSLFRNRWMDCGNRFQCLWSWLQESLTFALDSPSEEFAKFSSDSQQHVLESKINLIQKCNLLQPWFETDFFPFLSFSWFSSPTLFSLHCKSKKINANFKRGKEMKIGAKNYLPSFLSLWRESWCFGEIGKSVMSNKLNEQLCFITVRSFISCFLGNLLFTVHSLHKKALLNCLECSKKQEGKTIRKNSSKRRAV